MLAFPTTTERFMKYQEKLAGQTIPDDLAKVVDEWTPVYNLAYDMGLHKNERDFNEMLKQIVDLSRQCEVGSPTYNFLIVSARWVLEAFNQGSAKNN